MNVGGDSRGFAGAVLGCSTLLAAMAVTQLVAAQQPPPPPADEASIDLSAGAPLQAPPPPAGARDDEDGRDGEDEDSGPAHGGTQRNFGFGPRIAGLSGFGAGARASFRYFGFDVAGGWQPLFPTIPAQQGEEEEAEFFHSWQLNLTVHVPFNPDSMFVAGAMAGYVYNSVFGRGVALAFDGVLNVSNHFGVLLQGGPSFYPDAADRLREEADLPAVAEFTDPGPALQIGIGAGLMIYP